MSNWMVKRLHRIEFKNAVFGIETIGGLVFNAAPMADWTIGKNWEYVKDYYLRKGAKIYEYQILGC